MQKLEYSFAQRATSKQGDSKAQTEIKKQGVAVSRFEQASVRLQVQAQEQR